LTIGAATATAPRLPPPVVLVLCGAIAWLLPAAWASPLPRAAHLAGIAIAIFGLCLNIAPKRVFRRHGTTVNPLHPERSTQLVTTGPYRWTRNPMYLGHVLLLLGWALWLGQPLALLCVAAYALWIDRLQIPAEERILRARFGAAYDAYLQRVRRWF